MSLHFRALGSPKLTQDGAELDLPPAWPLLLLGFLASHEAGALRSEVVATFWPDEPERTARHNLSQLLYRYRLAPWTAGLEVGPQRLRWVAESDLGRFWETVAAGDWHGAATLGGGEFLSGVQADRSASVATWLEETRSELARTRRDAVLRHAAALGESGQHAQAADALRPLLAKDLLAEDVLHAYLRSALPAGRRAEGLELYEAFKRKLRDELAVEPLPLTEQLADALRRAQTELPPAAAASPEAALAAPAPGAAVQAASHQAPFVGRDIELAELANSLDQPDCRLLTVVGPGGAGKSRIALRLAAEQAAAFAGGAHFVALAALDAERHIVPAIASALGTSGVADDLTEQVKRRLAAEPTLLVLDNFEHLLAGAGVVDDLLAAVPDLKIVATSRAPLGLSYEQCYDLGGLSFPSADQGEFNVAYDAVQLLLASARRASSSFMLQGAQKPAVMRICRLLGGLPLGLELAGSWLRLLSPAELASELAADLDLLESSGADRPSRHRSLGVVFEHSWQMLNAGERRALARLSLFRGGFDTAAARAVTQAPLKTLLALVGKSLLGRTRSGRFELLETVRQYAEKKLKLDALEEAAARRRHAAHYLALAEEAEVALKGAEQGAWLDLLALERDNFRAAVGAALVAEDAETGLRLVNALQQFWWVRGPYDEGPAATTALLALPGAAAFPALQAKARHRAATLVQLQGDMDAARAGYQAALTLSQEQNELQTAADCLQSLGSLASLQGDADSAFEQFEAAAALQRGLGDLWGLSVTLNGMGLALFFRGEYGAALPLLSECLEIKERLGDPQGIAYALNNLGTVHLFNGDLDAARRYTAQSLSLKEELGDQQGAATSLANLGRLAFREGDHPRARLYLRDSIERLMKLDNHVTLLWVVTAMVKLEGLAGRFDRSVRLAGGCRALAHALGIRTLPASNEQEINEGLELAALELTHERIQQLLDEGAELAPPELAGHALDAPGSAIQAGP